MTNRLTGSALTKLRRAWSPIVSSGSVTCWRCTTRIKPGQPWDLGHPTDLALGGHRLDMVPEHRHAQHCPAVDGGGNRSRGAHLGNQLRRARRARRRIEDWTS